MKITQKGENQYDDNDRHRLYAGGSTVYYPSRVGVALSVTKALALRRGYNILERGITMENISNIMTTIFPLLVLAIAAAAMLWLRQMKRKQSDAADPEKNLVELLGLQRSLEIAIFGIVTSLQREYGGENGTGQFKLTLAFERALGLIPEKWRNYFDDKKIIGLIEDRLEAARIEWKASPALLKK